MALDRVSPRSNVIDILDHVLDKGIVIDAWMRVSVGGIDLITVEARMLVASLQTYVSYADALAGLAPVASRLFDASAQRGRRGIHEQLQRVRGHLEAASVPGDYERRRAEDRILEDLRDSRARTLPHH